MYVVENERIRVDFDSTKASFRVWDKSVNYMWQQVPVPLFEDVYAQAENVEIYTRHHCKELAADLRAPSVSLKLRLVLPENKSDLHLTLGSSPDNPLVSELFYPYPLATNFDEGWIVLPEYDGFLLPMKPLEDLHLENSRYTLELPLENPLSPQKWNWLFMRWFGIVDLRKGCGYSSIVETPYDAWMRLTHVESQGLPALCPQVCWVASKGTFSYDRKILYHFSTQGGYVALAKRYREYAIKNGFYRSLRDKALENPDVYALIGAPDMYVWETPEGNLELAREMREAGIEKALFCLGPTRPWPPAPNLWRRTIEEVKRMGYLFARYDNYNVVTPMDSGGLPSYSGDYAEEGVKRKDGTPLMHPDTRRGALRCYVVGERIARATIKRELSESGYTARFIDTITAWDLRECYDLVHPTTREEDVQYRAKLLDFASVHQVVGTEYICGSWAIPYVHYAEGPMSYEHYRDRGMKHGVGFVPSGEYSGAKVEPGPIYGKYGMDEYYRVPLLELVFHDCLVSTWHWREGNQYVKGYWDKHDLFNILYGTIPLWHLNLKFWRENKDRFVKCYRDVCRWHEKIGFDEMVDHRWLTDDRAVQMSTFSSGLGVIVNFGNKPYVTVEGETVEPGSYLIISTNPEART